LPRASQFERAGKLQFKCFSSRVILPLICNNEVYWTSFQKRKIYGREVNMDEEMKCGEIYCEQIFMHVLPGYVY